MIHHGNAPVVHVQKTRLSYVTGGRPRYATLKTIVHDIAPGDETYHYGRPASNAFEPDGTACIFPLRTTLMACSFGAFRGMVQER